MPETSHRIDALFDLDCPGRVIWINLARIGVFELRIDNVPVTDWKADRWLWPILVGAFARAREKPTTSQIRGWQQALEERNESEVYG